MAVSISRQSTEELSYTGACSPVCTVPTDFQAGFSMVLSTLEEPSPSVITACESSSCSGAEASSLSSSALSSESLSFAFSFTAVLSSVFLSSFSEASFAAVLVCSSFWCRLQRK
jgi:hypothetical protein